MKRIAVCLGIVLLIWSGFLFGQADIMKKLSSGQAAPIKRKFSLPFGLEGHKILVPIRINQGRKAITFVLDTGAMTVIDTSITDDLKLSPCGEIPEMSGKQVPIFRLANIQLGEAQVDDLIVPAVDMKKTFGEDMTFKGLLGSDFLRFFRLTIDYPKRRIGLDMPLSAEQSIPPNHLDLSFRFPFHFPMIDASLDGAIDIPAMIDTGSPFELVLPLSFFERLEGPVRVHALRAKGVIAKWPMVSPGPTYLARIGKFKMGPWEIPDLLVLFTNLPPAFPFGLIGKNLLDRAPITLDYPSGKLVFSSPPGQGHRTNLFSIGLVCDRTNGTQTLACGIWENSPADRAGIEAGSEILSINGLDARRLSMDEIRRTLEEDTIVGIDLKIKTGQSIRRFRLEKKFLFPEQNK